LEQRKQDVIKDVMAQLAEVKKEVQAGKESADSYQRRTGTHSN
jgi:hypothetical protein